MCKNSYLYMLLPITMLQHHQAKDYTMQHCPRGISCHLNHSMSTAHRMQCYNPTTMAEVCLYLLNIITAQMNGLEMTGN